MADSFTRRFYRNARRLRMSVCLHTSCYMGVPANFNIDVCLYPIMRALVREILDPGDNLVQSVEVHG